MNAKKMDQFEARAPRYRMKGTDNSVLRFSAYAKGSKKLQTRILNLSETGMAFLLPIFENPKEGEIIKIEFQVPGGGVVACFARIMRLELHKVFSEHDGPKAFRLVAVTFIDLPVAHRKEIREGIMAKFDEEGQRHAREQFRLKLKWARQTGVNWILKAGSLPFRGFKKLFQSKK